MRELRPARQARPCWAHLLGDTYARLAAGSGVGMATVYRYVIDSSTLIAEDAPGLAQR